MNRVTERQEQKSNPEFQREYRNRIRETHDQLNLYLPKDAKAGSQVLPRLETHDMLSGVYITLRGYYRI